MRWKKNPNIDSTWGKANVAAMNISLALTPGRDIKTVEAPVRRLERVCFLLTERRCRSVVPQSQTGWGTRRWAEETPPPQLLPSDNPRLCSCWRRPRPRADPTALLGLLPLRSLNTRKIFNAILSKTWSSVCTGCLRSATPTEDYRAGRITTQL